MIALCRRAPTARPRCQDGVIEDEEVRPPSAERVAARAVVLACVVARANLETHVEEDRSPDAVERTRELVVARDELRAEAEPFELEILAQPLGGLSERQTIDASWRAEALAVVAWALGRFELPTYDQHADAYEVAVSLGMGDGDVDDALLDAPTLRSQDDLFALAEALLAAHWRIRQFGLDGLPLDFRKVAANDSWPLLLDDLPLAGGDLAVRGVPISSADESVVRDVESIVRERRAAVGWLRGEDELMSEVSLDT